MHPDPHFEAVVESARVFLGKQRRGGLSHTHGTRETLNPRVPVNLLAPPVEGNVT